MNGVAERFHSRPFLRLSDLENVLRSRFPFGQSGTLERGKKTYVVQGERFRQASWGYPIPCRGTFVECVTPSELR